MPFSISMSSGAERGGFALCRLLKNDRSRLAGASALRVASGPTGQEVSGGPGS